ncbi:MAG: AMP-binding protein [Pseudomonadota bacterium]
MTDYYDHLETREANAREAALFSGLAAALHTIMSESPGWATWLEGVDPASVTDRAALARVPVLRKPDLMARQGENPPFGGFVIGEAGRYQRVFVSPGPVYEPQAPGADPWGGARALFAAGFRKGDIVHNALSYHLTPGGFILDEAARALGCAVFPAGIGNTEAQVAAIASLRPTGYTGTPDYLKILLDHAAEKGHDASSIRRALVSGGALFPSLRAEYADRGVAVLQCYATADCGVIAYESDAIEGMIVNENVIVEIVRPGTDEPVAHGEVGEIVVTSLNSVYPLIRFGTGDLSAVLPGTSPCGRTNLRLKGWMGRADQRTKVKGMFVDPKQVDMIMKRLPDTQRARLVVSRVEEQDVMTLKIETTNGAADLAERATGILREVTTLSGRVELVSPGTLPNDGKIIADERSYDEG